MKVVLFALVAFGFLGLASSDKSEHEIQQSLNHIVDSIEQSADHAVDSEDHHKTSRSFESNGDQIISRREFCRGIMGRFGREEGEEEFLSDDDTRERNVEKRGKVGRVRLGLFKKLQLDTPHARGRSSDMSEHEIQQSLNHIVDSIEQSADHAVDSEDQHKTLRSFESNDVDDVEKLEVSSEDHHKTSRSFESNDVDDVGNGKLQALDYWMKLYARLFREAGVTSKVGLGESTEFID